MHLVFCDWKKTTTTLIESPLDMIETDNPNTLNQSNNTQDFKDEMQDYDCGANNSQVRPTRSGGVQGPS